MCSACGLITGLILGCGEGRGRVGGTGFMAIGGFSAGSRGELGTSVKLTFLSRI